MSTISTAQTIIRTKRRSAELAKSLTDRSDAHVMDELHYAASCLLRGEGQPDVEVVRLAEYALQLATMLRDRAEQRLYDAAAPKPTVPAERDQIVSGSIHELTTAKGSHVRINNQKDQYGRKSSHVVTGYDKRGHSSYYARNVSAQQVARTVRQAEQDGWTGIAANVEAF